MVLSTPRTLGSTTRRPGDRLVSVWLAAGLMLTVAVTANAQSANSRHARLSQDLAQLVKTNGDFKPTTVIITTSQPKVMTVRNLIGKEGSEVTVAWKDEAGARMATSVSVEQLVLKKGSRPKR